mmetsp:Transcript_25758/g.41616  ORF Transcript_25758/g.41616 Transcript_25758/m.41616 type:complete len:492 (+) Transcript_25758:608-2083(+)
MYERWVKMVWLRGVGRFLGVFIAVAGVLGDEHRSAHGQLWVDQFVLDSQATEGQSFSGELTDDEIMGKVSSLNFRPPATPLITMDPFFQTYMFVDELAGGSVRSWYGTIREIHGMVRVDGKVYRFLGACSTGGIGNPCADDLVQLGVDVGTTVTTVEYVTPNRKVGLTLRFVSTLFVGDDDYCRLSRPVQYVVHDVKALDGRTHSVQFYLDFSAEHVVNKPDSEVGWEDWQEKDVVGLKIGTTGQDVLGSRGDRCNLDWGYLYLGIQNPADKTRSPASNRGGLMKDNRRAFRQSGQLPSDIEPMNPRSASDDDGKVVLSFVQDMGHIYNSTRHVVLVGYDDIASVQYYGRRFKGYWTQCYKSITDAIYFSAQESTKMIADAYEHDRQETIAMYKAGGAKYAIIGRLAYRQTLAAHKLVWNGDGIWYFLKEISTNGDMQTVDVIFPMSPMLLYFKPGLLRRMLEPMLYFAANMTEKKYSKPYSSRAWDISNC